MMVVSEGEFSGRPMTPAHRYVYQSDFAKILDDISKDILPVGSGIPFPVEFDNPDFDICNMNIGWEEPSVTYDGTDDPASRMFAQMFNR